MGDRVRQATVEDLDALMVLEHLGFSKADQFTRQQFHDLLTRVRSVTFVEETDGWVCGMITLVWRQGGRSCRIYTITVHPRVRGQGVGRRLLERAETFCREEGFQRLSLEVRADNYGAQRLYQQAGFTRYRHLPDYYGLGEAGLRLVKVIS